MYNLLYTYAPSKLLKLHLSKRFNVWGGLETTRFKSPGLYKLRLRLWWNNGSEQILNNHSLAKTRTDKQKCGQR